MPSPGTIQEIVDGTRVPGDAGSVRNFVRRFVHLNLSRSRGTMSTSQDRVLREVLGSLYGGSQAVAWSTKAFWLGLLTTWLGRRAWLSDKIRGRDKLQR
jgi:hypothetical protein